MDGYKPVEVVEADRIISATRIRLPAIRVPLNASVGRVLREDITADADFPPFDRVMMDGVALRFSDWETGHRHYKIVGMQVAGSPPQSIPDGKVCIEVMTGAVIPGGCDTVIPYEQLHIDRVTDIADAHAASVKPRQHIHQRGRDRKKDELLLQAGRRLSSAEIGVAASVGRSELWVSDLPAVGLVSTGDELVDIEQTPEPHQIRRSNVYALAAALRLAGISPDIRHVVDDRAQLIAMLGQLIANNDVLVITGGVSMGKFDYVPEALEELGVQRLFHHIRQKPGKPFWFGHIDDSKVVFALPGNPVSSMLCLYRYFMPWLRLCEGETAWGIEHAILTEDVVLSTDLSYFLQVKVESIADGRLMAKHLPGGGSGDHANLLRVDGFLELPAGGTRYARGTSYRLIRFRS